MIKPELGTKRACVCCAVRFYDLLRVRPVCPKCGVAQPPDVARPRHAGRPVGRSAGASGRAASAILPDENGPELVGTADTEDASDEEIVPGEDDDHDVADLDAEISRHPDVQE